MAQFVGASSLVPKGFDPWSGHMQEATDQRVSFLFLSLSLSKMNKDILGGGF